MEQYVDGEIVIRFEAAIQRAFVARTSEKCYTKYTKVVNVFNAIQEKNHGNTQIFLSLHCGYSGGFYFVQGSFWAGYRTINQHGKYNTEKFFVLYDSRQIDMVWL